MNVLSARAPSLAVLLLVALLGGLLFGVVQETQEQSLIFWCFVGAALALSAASATIGPGDEARFRAALKTVPLLIVALLALSLGDFAAYVLEIDGRTLDGYNEGLSMSWQSKLAATLVMGAIYGTLLGLVAAMAAWMARRALVQARSP